ncbi:translation initiation factor IF-3 [bacterium]|nr:translation initiation factor IF-3 [bacterium]
MKRDELDRKYLRNERIRAAQVRLIDENGEMLGIVSREEALRRSRDAELDLIMVSDGKDYPVCKILDWGKFKYDLKKKEQKAKKNQVKTVVKEIKFSPKMEDHDYSYRKDRIIEFLKKGYYIKATVFYKGRTILHKEKGFEILQRLTKELEEYATIQKVPEMKGRTLTMMFLPKKGGKHEEKA